VLCATCSLVQLGDTVDPTVLFTDYPYLSSVSTTMVTHAGELANRLVDEAGLDANSLVLEIGSNDGYLLSHLVRRGIPVLGVDPADDAALRASDAGVPTVVGYFSDALAAELEAGGRAADVIVANNVMAHVPDVNDVVCGVARLLRPHGTFVMETPYIVDLLDGLAFDTIYHEHVFYYSVTALAALLGRHGLGIRRVERIAIHGGSLRVTAGRDQAGGRDVERILRDEAQSDITSVARYRRFGEEVQLAVAGLRRFLEERRAHGKRLAGYGAAAKTTMLLAQLGGADQLLEFVVDRNPRKQGRCVPGTKLLIHAPEELLEQMPDEVVLFPWNIADEVVRKEAEYQRRGGRFIIPLPEPRIVEPALPA